MTTHATCSQGVRRVPCATKAELQKPGGPAPKSQHAVACLGMFQCFYISFCFSHLGKQEMKKEGKKQKREEGEKIIFLILFYLLLSGE